MKRKNLPLLLVMLLSLSTYVQAQNFEYAKAMGSAFDDEGRDITFDAAGNIYVTGNYTGTVDFDPNAGVSNSTAIGMTDIFISKLDGSGNLVWSKSIGGLSGDGGTAITVDPAGNVYTCGYFFGTVDFDPNAGVTNLISVGGANIFILKLNASGELLWAKSFAGAENGLDIAVDATGNVYTSGYFDGSADFDPGAGNVSIQSAGGFDIFISKLDANGDFVWIKTMGGTGSDIGTSLALADANTIYLAGAFSETVDFDPGANTQNITSAGATDIFVTKFNSSGDLLWAISQGGPETDQAFDIITDVAHNVYTTGYFRGTADFDPGSNVANLSSPNFQNIYLSKLNSDGGYEWAKSMGGPSNDEGRSLAFDGSGNIFLTGFFAGEGVFDSESANFNLTSAGGFDIFIAKFTPTGNITSAKQMGGSNDDQGVAICIDNTNNIYSTGNFSGTADFDPQSGTFNLISAGSRDIFISKLKESSSGIFHSNATFYLSYIYPNPTQGQFAIQSGIKDARLTIYNAVGDIVLSSSFTGNSMELNLADKPKGIYFYTIQNKNAEYTWGKIVIE